MVVSALPASPRRVRPPARARVRSARDGRGPDPARRMSGFRRAGLKVLIGSAAGAGLALVLTPVLSRLVSPEVFGSFMTLVALASVFVGVSTMRLEVASQSEPDEAEA